MKGPRLSSTRDDVRDWVIERLNTTKGGQIYGPDEAEAIANLFVINRIDGQCFSEMSVERCYALGIPYGAALALMRERRSSRMMFEDFEGLINNIMMTAALLLSFSVTLHTGSKSLGDFTQADERVFRLFISWDRLHTMTVDDISSYRTNFYGCQAVSLFTVVLILGFSTSISLYLSTARSDPDFLIILCYPFKLVLGICCVLMFLGLKALFALNWSLVDVIYPIYDGDTPVADWFDPASGTLIEAFNVGKFTWVTQQVAVETVIRLNDYFIAFPVAIISCTYILYALWTHWPGRSNLQAMFDLIEDLLRKLAHQIISRVGICNTRTPVHATAGVDR